MINVEILNNSLKMSEVVERYTNAQKMHGKYRCPFHDDRNPSLSVKDNHWRCWSCNKGGDPINFIQELFGYNFVDACKRLSADWNIECGTYDSSSDFNEENLIIREIQRQRLDDIRSLTEQVEDEISKLTDIYRILFRSGCYELASQYSELLDALQDADVFTAYKLLGLSAKKEARNKEA